MFMSPSSIYSFFVIFLLHSPPATAARATPLAKTTVPHVTNTHTWQNLSRFINARRGSHVSGLSDIKRYFHHFGYLQPRYIGNLTDTFDDRFESAVIRYQRKLGLPATAKLDSHTLSKITAPRCGVPDRDDTAPYSRLHTSTNYVYFPGKPRWARQIPMTLTYAVSPEYLIKSLSVSDIGRVFKHAFATWESVIPVSFVEADDYGFADIKIGFYSGDHGDGEPFDGVLGVLAHSFSPEAGRLHLDAAEIWAVDFGLEKSKVAVDLESVAVHEIGHVLGLAHSSDEEAVMYPSLKPREKKVELSADDVQGVQALYGTNPNFTPGSLLESDISANQAVHLIRSSTSHRWAALILSFTPYIGI